MFCLKNFGHFDFRRDIVFCLKKSGVILCSVAGKKCDQCDHTDHTSMLFRRRRTFVVFEERHSLCSKKDILCVRSKTYLVFEAGHSLCSKQNIPCVRSKTFLVFI